jgi:hypothetical protein
MRCALRSFMQRKRSLRYDRVTWLPLWQASLMAASTALSPPPTTRIFLLM